MRNPVVKSGCVQAERPASLEVGEANSAESASLGFEEGGAWAGSAASQRARAHTGTGAHARANTHPHTRNPGIGFT